MLSLNFHSIFGNFVNNENNFISEKKIIIINEGLIYIIQEVEEKIKSIFNKNLAKENIPERMQESYKMENSYLLKDIIDIQFLNINQILINIKGTTLTITALDDRSYILIKAEILNFLKINKKAKKLKDQKLPHEN